jgi:hypothetical protein
MESGREEEKNECMGLERDGWLLGGGREGKMDGWTDLCIPISIYFETNKLSSLEMTTFLDLKCEIRNKKAANAFNIWTLGF